MLEGFFHAQDLEIYDQHRLTTCVHSNWQLKALQNARLKAPLDIYLKVNSGMNRLASSPIACLPSGSSCGQWRMLAR